MLEKNLLRTSCFIDGAWVMADSGETIDVSDPATGEVICAVPRMGAVETSRAIAAAHAAMPAWAAKTAGERATILRRFHGLMMSNQEALARILTREQGKSLAESRGEVGYAASFMEWFAEEGKRVYGDIIPATQADKRLLVIKQPVGVVAAITPWNFPSAMITRKIAPALAAGCAVVVKPASETPLSALALAALSEEAGLPTGLLSVVTGSATEIGRELTSNPLIRKVSFTGSTEIGRLLLQQCAATIKRTSMELGGNAPFIVFDDADINAAIEGAIASKFRNSGQTCVCSNRIYVQAGVHDAFVEKLSAAATKLRLGSGLEAETQIGPLINEQAVMKVEEHIKDALSKGARLHVGGSRHSLGGRFFQPTVMSDVTQEMAVAHEETFGPLAPVIKFGSESEAITLANDTEFGLAGYFYTSELGRVWRVAEALECGLVGVNTGLVSTEVAPFGGIKQSGSGREGSKYGIEDYLEIKYICMKI